MLRVGFRFRPVVLMKETGRSLSGTTDNSAIEEYCGPGGELRPLTFGAALDSTAGGVAENRHPRVGIFRCAGQCKSTAATDALVSLNLRWYATSVIHQLYNDAETDCRVEMMQYKTMGIRPSKAKLKRWSIYTSPHHLARFANESKEYVRSWTRLHKCRFESAEQCRLLITLQHRLQCDLNEAAPQTTNGGSSEDAHHEKYTEEGVSTQLIRNLPRGNTYVIGGRTFHFDEAFVCHSSAAELIDEDGDTTADEDNSPGSFRRGNTDAADQLSDCSSVPSPCVTASSDRPKERFVASTLEAIMAVVGRYCASQGVHGEEQRMLTRAVTTQMSQIGFANLEYSAVTTRQFVCEDPLQATTISLDVTADGTAIRLELFGRKSEFSSYAVGYEETPPDVMFIPCGPGSSRTLKAEILWRLRTAQKSSLDEPSAAQQSLAVSGEAGGVLAKPLEANRRSKLQAPTMLLTGHEAEVFCCDFSADGANLASGGFDKNILVWKVYGDCDNWCILKGHENAVLEVHWSLTEQNKIVSCSADKSVALWDVEEGKRIKKLRGHGAVVNSCQVTRRGVPLVVSGGDDGSIKLWDLRVRRCVQTRDHQYQVLSVTFDDTATRIFAGTLDNQILSMDIRKMDAEQNVIELGPEHDDSITGLAVSNDGNFLLSNSMDKSVKLWDIRPFVAHDSQRLVHHFTRGVQHDSERNLLRVRWSPDDQYFTTGNAKRVVNVWDVRSREILYSLPGHTGSVNEVCFHPSESYVIASASSDRTIYLGELA
ncbi:U5 small nuclear ribonucleoprotein [Perkinsus olseni]|uniref:U5 small nuclear ribonucleoprotein n=1 Tax=Perkinsus olseni TaxID=32597 RepID=A0A7J6ME25_PEROL|nr:U5 small nuclear ribonucleoprotein [Perkinsus olseni]